MKKLLLTILISFFASSALAHVATAPRGEVDYGSGWCLQQGGVGYQTYEPLGIRVDCVTETHIIEIAFHHSWRAAVKKAESLSVATGKSPGVAIIADFEEDRSTIEQLRSSAPPGMSIWLINERETAY